MRVTIPLAKTKTAKLGERRPAPRKDISSATFPGNSDLPRLEKAKACAGLVIPFRSYALCALGPLQCRYNRYFSRQMTVAA